MIENNSNNLILIGFMGSGKSSFGKWISENHNKRLIDTDEVIVAEEGRTINSIFEENGEEYFRDLETRLLIKIKNEYKNCVIAVGGGMPIREINQKEMKEIGKVIYLRTSIEELLCRLENDTTRPLLKEAVDRKTLYQKIESLMNKRKNIYESIADKIIDTDGKTYEEIWRELF